MKQIHRKASRQACGRTGASILDQAVSSLGSVVPVIVVAREMSPQRFGLLGVTFYVFLLLLGVSRSFGTDVFIVNHAPDQRDSRAERVVLAAVLLIATLGAGAAFLGAALMRGSYAGPLVALGCVLPMLLLQDACRYLAFARRAPLAALLSDAVMLVVQLLLIGVLLQAHGLSVMSVILSWGAGAAVGALAGCLVLHVAPTARGSWRWILLNARTGSRFFGDFLGAIGARPVTVLLATPLVAFAAVGSLRGVQTLFGPITMLDLAMGLILVPEGVRRHAAPAQLYPPTALAASLLAGAALAWGGLLLALPSGVGHALLGSTWVGVRPLVLPTAFFIAANGVAAAAWSGLRILKASGRGLRTRSLSFAIVVAMSLGGAALGGIRGLVDAQAIAGVVAAFLYWRAFRSEVRDADLAAARPPALAGVKL